MDFRTLPANGQGSLQRYSSKPTNCDRMRWSLVAVICIIYLLTVNVPRTCAGTAHEESRANGAASNQTTVNLPQPQGQCLLDGILVAETTVFCEKQSGCRAIQKTGYCCPNYKCDCEKNGRTYSNGDKLVDPETPCTVCYCQGGEILCSSVTCFHRDDCKPKFVTGRCCPEYDNCPVSSSESPTLNKNSVNETAKFDLLATTVNNPKITIKEITKPTEIRITDDNKQRSSCHSVVLHTPTEIRINDPPTQQLNNVQQSTMQSSDEINTKSSAQVSSLSTTNNHQVSPGILNFSKESLLSAVKSRNNNVMSNVQSNAPTRLTNEKSHFDANENPIQSVIDIANAGENDAVHDPSKVNNKREFSITTEPDNDYTTTATETHANPKAAQLSDSRKTSAEMELDTAGSDNIYHIIMTTNGPQTNFTSWQKLAESSNKLEKTIFSMPITESWSIEETVQSNNYTTTRPESENNTTYRSIKVSHTTFTTSDKLSEGMQHNMEEEDITVPIESNPAYPSLPIEDFSLRDFPLSDTDDNADERDEPRSIGISYNKPKVTSSHIDEYTTDGSGSGMIMEYFKPTVNVFRESTTTENIVKYPEKIELMFSAEDSSEETSVSNNTDFHSEQFMKEMENETGSGEALNLYSLVMVPSLEHGSGEILKAMASKDKSYRREHTTPRPTKRPAEDIDLDDLKPQLGDDKLEPIEDPKLDVESLKLDENDELEFTNSNTMSNGNAITIKTSPKHSKLLVELDGRMLVN